MARLEFDTNPKRKRGEFEVSARADQPAFLADASGYYETYEAKFAMMASSDPQTQLLFGVLAHQMHLITLKQLVQAAREKFRYADPLSGQGWIQTGDQQDVEKLLAGILEQQQGNVGQVLAAALDAPLRSALAEASAELRAWIAALPPPVPGGWSTIGFDELDAPDGARSLADTRMLGGEETSDASTNPELPRYTFRAIVGEGGIGRVWRVYDSHLRREVALKHLRRGTSVPESVRKRFVQEALVTGQLDHPGIVPVYDLVNDGAQLFYTMRLIAGQTLAKAIEQHHGSLLVRNADAKSVPVGNADSKSNPAGGLNQQRLLNVFLSVCQAVAFAHSRNTLHRDLKPDNVILGAYGEVSLLDWGLARLDSSDPVSDDLPGGSPMQTLAGAVMGTPAYMAPEQARGDVAAIDQRTDVFALGGILFAILTGRAPHEGEDTGSVVAQVASGQVRAARDVRPTIPRPLDAICAKAMAPALENRYPSAQALALDVERWLADEPVEAYPQSMLTRLVMDKLLASTRNAEITALHRRAWFSQGLVVPVLFIVTNVLIWKGVTSVGAYAALWTAGLAAMALPVWLCRFRDGPPMTAVEGKIGQLVMLSLVVIPLTVILNIQSGQEIVQVLPTISLEASLLFGGIAILMGGEFYVTAAASVLAALLMAVFPQIGPASFGTLVGAGLIFAGLRSRHHAN